MTTVQLASKVEVHRYTMKPRRTGALPRVGALLRVTFKDLAEPGLADLFPWKEYGDPALEDFLKDLSTMNPVSFTLQRAFDAARDEALAVSEGRPLVGGSIVNHALATDPTDLAVYDILQARRSTCPAIKIKIGRHEPEVEALALSRMASHWGIGLRLDVNERWTREQLLTFLDGLPIRIRESLEFIEDPFPFNLREWSAFHSETGIDIAYDRGTHDRGVEATITASLAEMFSTGAAQVLIHKPAWQDDARAILAQTLGRQVVVTSILGHPIGNLWAASRAFQLVPDGVHGCMSHGAYREDEATKVLLKSKQVRGSRVVGNGVGAGLHSPWLRRLRWETLAVKG